MGWTGAKLELGVKPQHPLSSRIHPETNFGLKPRPSGRCEGWNPGLKAGVSTVATREGMQTPSSFVVTDRHECLSLMFVAGVQRTLTLIRS
jgi:hypothetical protein